MHPCIFNRNKQGFEHGNVEEANLDFALTWFYSTNPAMRSDLCPNTAGLVFCTFAWYVWWAVSTVSYWILLISLGMLGPGSWCLRQMQITCGWKITFFVITESSVFLSLVWLWCGSDPWSALETIHIAKQTKFKSKFVIQYSHFIVFFIEDKFAWSAVI